MKSRDLSLAAVGKGTKKKTANMNMESLETIKAWSGLDNSMDMIKRLRGQL